MCFGELLKGCVSIFHFVKNGDAVLSDFPWFYYSYNACSITGGRKPRVVGHPISGVRWESNAMT